MGNGFISFTFNSFGVFKENLDRIAEDARLRLANRSSQLLIALGGKAAKVGKAIAVANVVRGGIEGVQNAYTTAQKSPITIANPFYPTQQAISAGLFSALQLQRILASGNNSASLGNVSRLSSESTSAPSFNLVQGTGSNQIASAIQSDRPPIKTFVVASEVKTGLELERNKISQSSL